MSLAAFTYNVAPNTQESPSPTGTPLPIGTIMIWSSFVAPTNFLMCDGTVYDKGPYSALFAVIGTTFGSSGPSGFRVPNLTGNDARGFRSGVYNMGQTGGAFTATLNFSNLPPHYHTLQSHPDSTNPTQLSTSTGSLNVNANNLNGPGSYITGNTYIPTGALVVDPPNAFSIRNAYYTLGYVIKWQ